MDREVSNTPWALLLLAAENLACVSVLLPCCRAFVSSERVQVDWAWFPLKWGSCGSGSPGSHCHVCQVNDHEMYYLSLIENLRTKALYDRPYCWVVLQSDSPVLKWQSVGSKPYSASKLDDPYRNCTQGIS